MSSEVALPVSPEIPFQDAISIIIQLRPFESHSIWRGGKLIFTGSHHVGALAITDLREGWRCLHGSSFDNLRLQLTRDGLGDFSRDLGVRPPTALVNPEGAVDSVVLNLARALVPSLENPEQSTQLFVDQVVGACLTHVIQSYGGKTIARGRRPRLTQKQATHAMEILATNLQGDLTVLEIAEQCGLSRSYFIRAFRETVGKTPHQWLLGLRIDLAKTHLAGKTPISEIVPACGFADQSHFTRTFKNVTGVTPAEWRRRRER